MKSILITGGAGFIGTAIARSLMNDYNIILFDKFSRNSLIYNKDVSDHDNIEVIKGDILSETDLNKIPSDINIVIHCAAVAGVNNTASQQSKTLEINLIGTNQVLKHIKTQNRLSRFINLSTSEVYGQTAYNVNEKMMLTIGPPSFSRWSYALSKLAAEHLVYAEYASSNLPIVNVRPFNVYGPGQVGEGAISKMCLSALAKQPIKISGNGSQVRSWCYISDFVDSIKSIISDEKCVGKTYNIGNPSEAHTIISLARQIYHSIGLEMNIQYNDSQAEDVYVRVPDISSAKQDLNFNPKINLIKGIDNYLDWITRVNFQTLQS